MSCKRKPALVSAVLYLSCVLCGLRSGFASAYLLNLEGGIETPGALYAQAPNGRLVKLLQRGASAPQGGTISDIGVPALAPDGSVIFGAEVTEPDKIEWRIFQVNPLSHEPRVEPLLDDRPMNLGCRPALKIDPRLSTGADGSVAFVGNEERGGAALFHYAKMGVDCEVRAGDRTAQGHLIANLGFGSAQTSGDGFIVLQAHIFLGPGKDLCQTRSAILLARQGKPPLEIAVEGNRSPDSDHYGAHFGLPAIAQVDGEIMVAFTNHNPHGSFLFLGQPDDLHAVLSPTSRPLPGPPVFLAEGRPSIAPDGSLAIVTESGANSLILTIRTGESFVVAHASDQHGSDQEFTGLGDPVQATKGTVYAEAVGRGDSLDRLYSFSFSRGFKNASSALSSANAEVFPGSLAVDATGRYAFLARTPEHQRQPVISHPPHLQQGRSI